MATFGATAYSAASTAYNADPPTYIDGTAATVPASGTATYSGLFGNVMCAFMVDGGDSLLGGNVIVSGATNLAGGITAITSAPAAAALLSTYTLAYPVPSLTGRAYNTISATSQVWYYPFSSVSGANIYNYATGTAVQDAAVQGALTTVANNRMTIPLSASSPRGVVVNNVVACAGAAGVSFSFWVYFTALNGSYGFLLTLQDATGYPGGSRFYISANPSNGITVNSSYNTATLSINTPYHVAVTITSAGAGVMYLNNASSTFSVSYPSFTNVSGRNYLGHDPAGVGFAGWMQEARLYTRVISAAEVAVLYAAGYNA